MKWTLISIILHSMEAVSLCLCVDVLRRVAEAVAHLYKAAKKQIHSHEFREQRDLIIKDLMKEDGRGMSDLMICCLQTLKVSNIEVTPDTLFEAALSEYRIPYKERLLVEKEKFMNCRDITPLSALDPLVPAGYTAAKFIFGDLKGKTLIELDLEPVLLNGVLIIDARSPVVWDRLIEKLCSDTIMAPVAPIADLAPPSVSPQSIDPPVQQDARLDTWSALCGGDGFHSEKPGSHHSNKRPPPSVQPIHPVKKLGLGK